MKKSMMTLTGRTLLAACAAIIATVAGAARAGDSDTFDFVVQTDQDAQKFAFQVDGAANFDIDWGDGASESGLTLSTGTLPTAAPPPRPTSKTESSSLSGSQSDHRLCKRV